MTLNPYQTIVVNGSLVQKGDMDTIVKFKQLTEGIDLKDKRVLDCGCNLGMISSLATLAGATTLGIDINRDYISQANQLFPKLSFKCRDIEDIYGRYDLIIASAVLHYLKDLDSTLKLFSFCSPLVTCDVWLNDSEENCFTLSHRNLYIPSKKAFEYIASKYFSSVVYKGLALTPDTSKRYIYHLSNQSLPRPNAILISGDGNVGKSTMASTFIGYKHILTDNLFNTWKVSNMSMMFSAGFFANLIRGSLLSTSYLPFITGELARQLTLCTGRDVVIEGYELLFDDFRLNVLELLKDWNVKEIKIDTLSQYGNVTS